MIVTTFQSGNSHTDTMLTIEACEAICREVHEEAAGEARTRELQPVECSYRGYGIISAPPPSSGGVVICERPALNGVLPPCALASMFTRVSMPAVVEANRFLYAEEPTGAVEDIVATVSDEFDAQPETVEADVLRFIDEITERGMTAD